MTIEMMKNVAEAYDRGAIEVTEQPALYRFTVRFVDTLGAPPNLDDLKKAIESIKPAHLVVAYQYKYLLVNQVQGMSITDLQQSRLTDFAPFIPV
ncbi:putative phage tail protein [Paenibacillus sp. TAB 01]|uniref:putative phage tail protein n=1 Tax=Paenibacillus sp. TAB 01 TaxID=3368988 RepID=UPI003753430F